MIESKIQEKTIKLLRENRMAVYPIEFRGRRGCPDLIVFHLDYPHKSVFLELKTATGKRSEHQIQTAAEFQIWGQAVGLTRTPEEALEFCQRVFYGDKSSETEKTAGGKLQSEARPVNVDNSSRPIPA